MAAQAADPADAPDADDRADPNDRADPGDAAMSEEMCGEKSIALYLTL